jgi:hypothetical protein
MQLNCLECSKWDLLAYGEPREWRKPLRLTMNMKDNWKSLLIGVILLLVRIPFFRTYHLQEDAFIIFRTALNLADHGSYAYNIGTSDNGITCHAYAFLVAALRLLFGAYFIPAVQLLNTGLIIAGIYLFATAIERRFLNKSIIWVAASITPIALLTSYLAMESSLLIFMIGLSLYNLCRESRPTWLYSLPLFLLPWIRPDAVAYGAILIAAFSFRNKRLHYQSLVWLLAGCVSLAGFNFLMTGHFLNQTIIAKKIAYPSDMSGSAILRRGFEILFTKSIYCPLGKTSFPLVSSFFGVFTLSVIMLSLWISRKDREQQIVFLILGAFAILVPLPYIYEGVMFEWYFAVSSLCGILVTITVATNFVIQFRSIARLASFGLASLLLLLMALGRMISSLDVGAECMFFTGIGSYIKSISNPTDTLFLEPAGYIPFYAGIKTYEEVGLSTFSVVEYRLKYGKQWWIRFLQTKRPTVLVERDHIESYSNLWGYTMTDDERAWFDQNYELARKFEFKRSDHATFPFTGRITSRLKSNRVSFWISPIYVFRLRQPE